MSLAKHLCQGAEGSAASSASVSDVDNSLDSPSVSDVTPSQSSATVEEGTTGATPLKAELLSSAGLHRSSQNQATLNTIFQVII